MLLFICDGLFFSEKNVLCVLVYLQIPSKLRVYLRNLHGDMNNSNLKDFLLQAQGFESSQISNIHCLPGTKGLKSAFVTFTSTELRNRCVGQLDQAWNTKLACATLLLVHSCWFTFVFCCSKLLLLYFYFYECAGALVLLTFL